MCNDSNHDMGTSSLLALVPNCTVHLLFLMLPDETVLESHQYLV